MRDQISQFQNRYFEENSKTFITNIEKTIFEINPPNIKSELKIHQIEFTLSKHPVGYFFTPAKFKLELVKRIKIINA